jgi:5-(carboxyamino)imidazole ribonucleotide synthase
MSGATLAAGNWTPADGALPPGSWLGVLGGGQLGRMFCAAAQALGYRVCVLDPDPASPAGRVADHHLQAAYLDEAALDELARRCAAITTEFENVPAAALDRLAATRFVAPAGRCVAIAQDRRAEKSFARDCGLAVAPWAAIRDAADLHTADPALFPGILKAARLGYDGKGQARVADRAQALAAFEALGAVPCVLEQRMALARELSAIVVRAADGRSVVYPIAENEHRDGILARSIVPARVSQDVAWRAGDAAQRIAQAMNYIGVLCVEFFLLDDGRLLVNEMAPRPHNSGHWSIEGCVTSQFEQQARVLAGLPPGSVRQLEPSVMINLLGDLWFGHAGTEAREPDWAAVLAHPDARLLLYGKDEPRHGRKMGHLTVLADSVEQGLHEALAIERLLGIGTAANPVS